LDFFILLLHGQEDRDVRKLHRDARDGRRHDGPIVKQTGDRAAEEAEQAIAGGEDPVSRSAKRAFDIPVRK